MKVLVVGHSFLIAWCQQKYAAMKKLDSSLELRLACPRVVRHPFGEYHYEVCEDLQPQEIVPLPYVLSGSNMTYILDFRKLGALLREFRPDIVHIEEEPHALVTVQTIFLHRWARSSAPISLFTWDNIQRPRRFPIGVAKRRLRRFALERATLLVCGNQEAADLIRLRDGYRRKTVVLPQLGADPQEHQPGSELQLRRQLGLGDELCVGFMGRLVPEKGIVLLLQALASLRDLRWKLLLVGTGPLEEKVRTEWVPRFNDRIVLHKAVSHSQVPRYLRCMDIFVLGSYRTRRWKEQFGLTLVQAMMLGIPCVGSSSGAIPEVLGPGGLVFEEGNINDLRNKLELLLSSTVQRKELGMRAREFACKNYTLHQVAKKYLELFANMLDVVNRSSTHRD